MSRKYSSRKLEIGLIALVFMMLSTHTIGAKRVVGGETIAISAAPYQVAIGKAGVETFHGQFCGGTIIDEKWILTAAHCFLNDDQDALLTRGDLMITVGEATLSTAQTSNQYNFTVQDNVYIHPGFSLETIDNDIALIQLPTAINLDACGANCSAIEYANSENEATLAPLSTRAWASGWGATSQNVPILIDGVYEDPENYTANPSDTLKEVELRIVACEASLTGVQRTERVICAGALDMNQEDTCQGDSGGPLVVQNNQGTGFTVVGVNSYGHGCAAGEEGAYTRVSKYDDWINTRLSNPTVSPSEVGTEEDPVTEDANDMTNSEESNTTSNAAILKGDGGGSVGFLFLLCLSVLVLFRSGNRTETRV